MGLGQAVVPRGCTFRETAARRFDAGLATLWKLRTPC
jgi:hypothetical protein